MPNMYQEYLDNFTEQTKRFGKKVAIFLMVGIFYEMYDVMDPESLTNNKGKTTFSELVDLLGLKVSVKKGEGPDGLDGLVAGIPEHALHKWSARLTQLGWTVVLVEQQKNVQGKVVKRNVERILTPGTHVEAATQDDMYLTFVSLTEQEGQDAPYISTVALDLTTGHLHVFDTKAQGSREAWTSNDIVQFMELYPPREVLWSTAGSQWQTTGSQRFSDISETKIKSILGCSNGTTFHRREALTTGAWTKPDFREAFLKEQCSLKSLLPTHVALHLAPGSRTETTLLSLLYSLKDLWPSMKLGTLLVYPWVPGSTMRLGENALVQLHMILQGPDQGRLDVLSLVDKCVTPMGHRGLRERLLKPSADPQAIRANLDAVEEWTKKDFDPIIKRLKTMTDIDRLYRKLQQGQLQSTDLIAFDTTFKAMTWISQMNDVKEIYETVFKVFSIDKVYAASEDTSLFQPSLCPDLDTIEQQIKEQWSKLNQWIEQVARLCNVAADTFKVDFREASLVIKGPRGILQSLNASNKLPSGTTAKLNKTGSHLESAELDQVYVVLMRLREALRKKQAVQLVEHGSKLADQIFEQWVIVADWITKLDVNIGLAKVAKENGYSKPLILDGSESSLEIQGLRHPLLEAQDRRVPYVQHNISLTPQQSWLLYGLNASGKSSLMRSTGLATLLAQGGSFVPCSSMKLVPFQSLHTRIINTDNLWLGLSSFAVEMSELRDIFRDAGPRSLVLGDELCSGTETTSATALVAAGLKGLIKRGSRFLFATHLHGLSKIEEVSKNPGLKIWHLHVEYDHLQDKLVYHRTLREGSGSSLYGLEVAKAMRIPVDILEDAIRFRKSLAGEIELSESVGSSWNSNLIRIKCEICGLSESKDLEVHHIRPRYHASDSGHLSDLSNVHSKANLLVLCDICHDKVHAETLHIGPLIETSDGMERSISNTVPASTVKQSKWSEEELNEIKTSYTKFPKLSIPALAKYLLNQHSIQISVPTLKKLLAKPEQM